MNEIILYLSLKYNCEWMAVYDSLKRKEKIVSDSLIKENKKVDANYICLLDDKYPNGLKQIYKPPFGVFAYGNFDLVLNDLNVTVFGKPSEENLPYMEAIRNAGGNIVWVDLSNREMNDVLSQFKTKNIFWMPELENDGNWLFHNLLKDETLVSNNAFISEVWKASSLVDYSTQAQERMYVGVTHKVLVLDKLESKRALALSDFGMGENVTFVFKTSCFDEKTRKLFNKSKVALVAEPAQLMQYFA